MGNVNKKGLGCIYVRLAILVIGILLLAFVDVIVLERIYKPISTEHGIEWSKFEVRIPFIGDKAHALWWHIAFIPLGIVLFILVGMSGRDLGLALAGILLFATGWEDIAYYAIQFKMLPDQLPWLNVNPFITWARIFTGSAIVTRIELFISAGAGGILTLIILFSQWLWQRSRWSGSRVTDKPE